MITAMVTIDFLNKFNYNPDQITFGVRKASIMISGTTASLKIG